MHHEFCNITNLQIPYEQYANEIEPLYMQSKLLKQEFCSKWLKKYNRTNKPTCILKDVKKDIISSIKEFQSNRKYYNREYKKLVTEQLKVAKKDYSFYQDSEGNWLQYMSDTYRNIFNRQRFDLLDRWGIDDTFHIIYADGSEMNFNSEDILINSDDAKNISFTNIVYMHQSNGYINIDTEIGEFTWDILDDEEYEKRERHLDNMQIKYKTIWGLKQLAKLNQNKK